MMAECNTQWGQEFFNNNHGFDQPQEELMSLELEILNQLPEEGTILPDNILDEWRDFSDLDFDLEELPGIPSVLEVEEPGPPGLTVSPGTKRRVGRPVKTELRKVTELPTGKVTKPALQKARYRRMRDLNNIASQKCRLKK